MLCQSSLPEFDERNTADLKSNSFKRLLETEKGKHMRFANSSSWERDGKETRESKRVILDDSVKLLCYGDCSKERVNKPFFASYASEGQNGIIWPLGDSTDVDIVMAAGRMEAADRKFEDKKPMAILRERFRYGQHTTTSMKSSKFVVGDFDDANSKGKKVQASNAYHTAHIVYASDRGQLVGTEASARSILENTRTPEKVAVHIFRLRNRTHTDVKDYSKLYPTLIQN